MSRTNPKPGNQPPQSRTRSIEPKNLVLRFGIPTLDQLLGLPSSEPDNVRDNQMYGVGLHSLTTEGLRQDAISMCLIGGDGVGKSILAMHLAARYRADVNGCKNPDAGESFNPIVLYASTDLSFGRAEVSWRNFGLEYPDDRISDPFDIQHVLERISSPVEIEKRISLELAKPLDDPLSDDQKDDSIGFIDLANDTTGDDWGYVNRLVGALPDPKRDEPKHLLVVDAVEGLEVLVGEVDAYGQRRDRRSRVAQLIRTAADKCHLVFLVESNEDGKKTPEEFIADAVIRLGSNEQDGCLERFVRVEKVRAQSPVLGSHSILFRPGKGSTTGEMINPDDPPVVLPQYRGIPRENPAEKPTFIAPFPSSRNDLDLLTGDLDRSRLFVSAGSSKEVNRGWQAYVYVMHSLNLVNRRVMDEAGKRVETRKSPLAGFAIENLDNLLSRREPGRDGAERDNGDLLGLATAVPVALIGEDGTYKSKLSKAFLAQAKIESSREETIEAAVLITTKTLESEGLRERLEEHRGKRIEQQHRVFCRRLEVHSQSAESLFHIILQTVRRAQASILLQLDKNGNPGPSGQWLDSESDRRAHGWRIRLVIDNWTSIRDMYPRVQKSPLFLPCLMFFLRREGVATLIVGNEDRGFSNRLVLKANRRLRDLTAAQIFTWRVPYFGENRVAITVNPPLRSDSQGSVIRELKVLERLTPVKPKPGPVDPNDRIFERPNHMKDNQSWKVAVDRSFELYEGVEQGVPTYVPMRVQLYSGSGSAKKYFSDVRYLLDFITSNERDRPHILEEVAPENYDQLREFCEVQGLARYPYTLVLQVDEYWSRSQALQLRSQEEYLNAVTAEAVYRRDSDTGEVKLEKVHDYISEDPFRLFQPTNTQIEEATQSLQLSPEAIKPIMMPRHSFFSTDAFSLEPMLDDRTREVRKIPYAWDFGFMMLNRCAWKEAQAAGRVSDLVAWSKIRTASDRAVKQEFSWIKFAESCVAVAQFRNSVSRNELHFVPFSVAPELQETVSCVFLEILASEIEPVHSEADAVFPPRREQDSVYDLGQILDKYTDEACKALLVMSALLPPEVMTDENSAIPPNQGNNIPVAVRTWFSAAEATQIPNRVPDIYVPTRLPGTRSVRGDWFLAMARGSRSYQMGERAIDLLCSRRGNISRLQNGIGLPVRDLSVDQQELWTPLWHHDPDSNRRTRKVRFDELRKLGADQKSEMKWLWRSRIIQYDRHARVLRRFICSTLRQRDQLLGNSEPLDVLQNIDGDEFKKYRTRIKKFLSVLKRATIEDGNGASDE